METPQEQAGDGAGNAFYRSVFRLFALLIVVAGILIGMHMCSSGPRKAGEAVVGAMGGAAGVLDRYFGTRESFNATFGPIVSEQRFRRLQFYQRNQVCLFRIVRYRGKDGRSHDYAEFYKKESDKKDISQFPILLKQYCEWEAKGTFEFNFYVDMGDLSRWDHGWDAESFTLTLYPPDIEASTPAELEPMVYRCVADSLTVDERYTEEQLAKSIAELKRKLADDQKQFMYGEAKIAIAEHYRQFFRLIPNVRITKFPNIVVVFPHESKKDAEFGQRQ